jgi:hypothetical protein
VLMSDRVTDTYGLQLWYINTRFFYVACFDPFPVMAFTVLGVSQSHLFRHTALGRAPLDEGSARHRDLYLTTHNTCKKQKCMPPAGFEPTIPASERPKTHALDPAAIGDCQI